MKDPRIAVITPYYREPSSVLRRCHESVLAQDVRVDHFMIADGHRQVAVEDWNVKHISLPSEHGDNGNTPRAVGSVLAQCESYDFIAYLDADNWFHPRHLESLLAHQRDTKADVVSCFRTFHGVGGEVLDVSERAEDRGKHVDTSCYLISKAAFSATRVWGLMPRPLSPLCDRVFLGAIRHGRFSISSTRERTVAFETQYRHHYQMAGLTPPAQYKTDDVFKPGIEYLKSNKGIAECVDLLGFWPYHYF